MQNITYRRAQNSDSEIIKNILEEAFEEYEINLPLGYMVNPVSQKMLMQYWHPDTILGL